MFLCRPLFRLAQGAVGLGAAAGMTSCTAMLSGFQSSYISASYMANEQDICNSDLYYTEMETDLQIDIDKTEENYPGYDLGVFPLHLLLLYPLGEGIFAPQLRVVPEGSLPCQFDIFLCRPLLRLAQGARVKRAEGQVEQAREHLPTKRRLSFQPEVEVETGRTRRRLHFEQEAMSCWTARTICPVAWTTFWAKCAVCLASCAAWAYFRFIFCFCPRQDT